MSKELVKLTRGLLVCALTLLAVVALAACGGGDDTTSGGSETSGADSSGGSDVAAAEQVVEEASAPQDEWEGPASSPPAAKDKTVQVISCSDQEGCLRDVEGFVEAGEALGWKVNQVNTKGTVQELTQAVDQGIANKVDGIAVASFPAVAMPNQVERAEKAGIPIVIMLSGSEPPKKPGIDGGYLSEVSPRPQYKGEIAANWVIADSGGEAEVGIVTEEAFPIVQQYVEGFEKALSTCSGCSVAQTINVPVSELATKVTPAVSQFLQSNPDADYIFSYDAPLTYAAQAGRQTGRDITLVGSDGNQPNLEMIREGGPERATAADVLEWSGWAAADQLNRAFNGEPPAEEWEPEGNAIATKLITEENLPPKGQPYTGDFEFQKEFERLWGVG